jgi:hypothetical protein
MEHSDDSYLNGSDSHIGICPECGMKTYTCYDELCQACYEYLNPNEEEPIKCPKCHNYVDSDKYNFEHDKCEECLEYDAQEFAERLINRLSNLN